MKKLLPLLLIVYSSSFIAAQEHRKTFNWNDTSFYVGQQRTIGIAYGFDYLLEHSKDTLNKVVSFLKAHPTINLQLNSNAGHLQKGSLSSQINNLGIRLAVDYVRSQGIDSARFVSKEYSSEPFKPTKKPTHSNSAVKQDTVLLWANLTLTITSTGPTPTFNWNDHTFKIGEARRMHFLFDLDKATLRNIDSALLDTLVRFLNNNPHLRVEIDNYTDQQGAAQHNMMLSQARADAIRDTLIALGINRERILAKGWGATKPLYSQQTLIKMKTKYDREPEYLTNRRTEITIYACNYNLTFNYSDTMFTVGSQKKLHILYDLDKAGITEESKLVLDSLANFLKKNRNLRIEFGCHTDQQGSAAHDYFLSRARALSCVDYLLNKGIDSARMVTKGYGFTEPLIPMHDILRMKTKEEQMAAYARNRRTVVTIIGR